MPVTHSQNVPKRIPRSSRELTRLDLDYRHSGTRFLLFPQPPILAGFEEPETVWVSTRPEELGPGPQDSRMYVADAVVKTPYEFPNLPPYTGPLNPTAYASPDGHFDHLEPGTQQFEAAHMYGTLRWVLDIWETYFGQRLEWHFKQDYPRMELVPWLDWNNAQSGYGFIEAGYRKDDQGRKFPMNLNFDVLAHELGHTMLYSIIGMPSEGQATTSFFAFHESASDLVAIISLLHFDSIMDLLLERTSGDLYPRNILNRVGEVSPTDQIRLASNNMTLADVPDLSTPAESLTYAERHDISLPLTGAVFDLLVEIFQQNLVDRGIIDPELDEASRRGMDDPDFLDEVDKAFDIAYTANPIGFKHSLVDARDTMGLYLARAWSGLTSNLTFSDVLTGLLDADVDESDGWYQNEIRDAFGRHGIFQIK
ncbi:MAG: hypothetical protein DHS20C01_34200 [marine bacterium B5-7]|nr:MAG: hypothetical protein DHS20C01_34200 [marine bacterium B5-7]